MHKNKICVIVLLHGIPGAQILVKIFYKASLYNLRNCDCPHL